MVTTAELGMRGEERAARYLIERGWVVLARNVRRREGEIDIVARREDVLAFVEVKTRRGTRYGTPGESVTVRKQQRIRGLARALLADRTWSAPIIRFDVVEVLARPGFAPVLTHIEGAF